MTTALPARRHPAGFTFIEVLVVLALLAVLALTVLPQLGVPNTLQADLVARQVAADLRRTQELAIGKRAYYTLQFSPATAPYTSYTLYNASTLAVEPDFPKSIPTGVTVSGRQTFCFAIDGRVVDTCLTGVVGSDSSISVSSGTATSTVQVFWYTGRVKLVGP